MANDDKCMNAGTALLSFLAGAAVGAGIALLYAPKTGRELRGSIRDLTDDAVDKIKEYTKEAQDKVKTTLEEGKDMLMEKKSFDLPIPTIPGLTTSYPRTFHAEYDEKLQSYRFIFSGFAAGS